MKLVNRFYNEKQFRKNVEEALDVVDLQESQAWLKHPCTQALRNAIQADMVGILNVWLDSGYSDEKSVDATAQCDAKARGMAQVLDDILETVEQIGNNKLEGDIDDYAGGAQNFS